MVAVSLKKFFQAEDGIRDAQESRGLGDVYKRQPLDAAGVVIVGVGQQNELERAPGVLDHLPVSYTHLTLPTILRV